ncbi:hypothetical protein F9L33_12235 [Amylibacter sp. SFDW26]|uniref:hypothetical protein n=1 Tax=Amylibacter sp. SFDW26 TaxID=2652722 RepID=UPI0012622411|nr:hypothetical protein [Amylibacter sp. SFDW26]KAB7613364.1 hypothetical protein F9L33_12235 [Amylibacter sp. SFDW26]
MPNLKTTLITATFIATATSAQAGSKYLTGPEIGDLYTSHSFEYWGKTKGTSHYTPTTFTVEDETNGNFSGKWWIKDNKYCRKFNNGYKHCDKVKKEGNGIYSSRGYKFKLK